METDRLLPDHRGAIILCIVVIVAVLMEVWSNDQQQSTTAYPSRPIKIVVPFNAGGGTDAFARTIKRAIEENDLLPEPLVIVNVGGASGTIGSRRVKDARPDGYTVLLLHDAIVMAKYSGKVGYGPEAFTPVAGTSQNGTVVAARKDSRFASLVEAVDEAEAHPDSVTFGCNLGTPTHFVGLLLERERPGASFRFVQSGDGADRFAALKGGHIDLTVFSNEEFLRYESQGIRALGFFGEQRHAAMPKVPTAIEQGFNARAGIMQYWWMPKGTPPERVAVFADALEKAMETDVVRDFLGKAHSDPVFAKGDGLVHRIEELDKKVAAVDLGEDFAMPNLPVMVLAAVVVLGAAVAIRTARSGRARTQTQSKSARPNYALAAMCVALAGLYVLSLSVEIGHHSIGFRAATLVFVTAIGMCIARWRHSATVWVLILAVVMSLGLHYLFTQVFVTDLP